MYLSVLYFSFISFIVSILYGKNIGIVGTAFITVFLLLLCNLSSIYLFYEVCCLHVTCYIDLVTWINLDYLSISYSFIFDSLTIVMLLIITSISLFAHIYSIDYMYTDAHFVRFMSYLSLFTFCMIVLVTANNLLQLFIGWEGVGLCSYLLINFWFIRVQANKSAVKALFVNKISDLSLLCGIALVYFVFMSLNFDMIYTPIIYLYENHFIFFGININIISLICLLIFIGAIGKSAQVGLHIWLPDAMEGPTPVSSLIHAATMVTAGIFLIVRISFFFEFVNNISLIIILIGSITIFFSSTIGIFQNDIKKIIAYSTCSQIGYMFFICGYAGYSIGMFHLFNHAFFKALLFLTAGSIIHANNGEQDIRKMGGLFKIIPFSYISFFIGSISLMGFPFLTGYYSKDLIIELAYLFAHEFFIEYKYSIFLIQIFYWLAIVSIIFTSIYSIRLLSFVFLYEYNGFVSYICKMHDLPIYMNGSLFILTLFSIFVGFFAQDMMVGLGTDFWQNSLFIYYLFDSEYIIQYAKILPILYSIYGILLYILLYNNVKLYEYLYSFQIYPFFYKKIYFFNRKWYFDKIYNEYLVNYFINIFSYYITFKLLDKGIIEFFGPTGITKFFNNNIIFFLKLQTGFVYHYAGIILNIILLLFSIPILKLLLFNNNLLFFLF